MNMFKKITILTLIFIISCSLVSNFYINAEEVEFDISARSAILMEAKTGEVLYSKNPDKKLAPASMTKIMTMLLVMEALEKEQVSLNDVINVSPKASKMGGSQVYLEPGEKMTLRDLMKAIAISSANDASVAVAEYIAGTEGLFVKRMNEKAEELGMTNSYFYNTNGLPSGDKEITGNLTTANDLALLTKELLKYPQIFEWTSIWIDSLRDGEFVLNNTNKLVRHYAGADGLKTGYTSEAGYCVTATATRDNLKFIAVIMGAENSKKRFSEAAKLLSYGFNIYNNYHIIKKDQIVKKVDIWNGKNRELDAIAKNDLFVPMKRGEEDKFNREIILEENLKAPIKKGEIIGSLKIFKGNLKIEECELIAARKVEKTSIFKRFFRIVIKFLEKLINMIK